MRLPPRATRPMALQKLWALATRFPNLVIAVFVALQTGFSLSNRALWFSDEVRYANAYQNLVEGGHWVVLNLNGLPYPDKPPIFFWLLRIIDTIPGINGIAVFFVGAAVSGFAFVAATRLLAKTLGFSKEVQTATIFIMLSGLLIIGTFHYLRMDLLFSAFILLSIAALYEHYVSQTRRTPLLGYFYAGIGTLIKGPLALAFPLLMTLVFLAWTGTFRRFLTVKTLLGLFGFVAPVLVWFGGVIFVQGQSFLSDTVLGTQIMERATNAFHHKEPVHYYFLILPLAFVPWTGFAAALPFGKLKAALFSTRQSHGAVAYLTLGALSIFVLLSALSGKVAIYVMPILPLLAILIGNSLFTSPTRAARGWLGVALFLAGLGIALLFTLPSFTSALPQIGMVISVFALLIGAFASLRLRHGPPHILLPVLAIIASIWVMAISITVLPTLDDKSSPRDHAQAMQSYASQGYTPISYKTYPGIFTYYLGQNLFETDDIAALTRRIEANETVVLVMLSDDWAANPALHATFNIVFEQNIAGGGGDYIVAIKD